MIHRATTRTCNNGAWSPDYPTCTYLSCAVNSADCVTAHNTNVNTSMTAQSGVFEIEWDVRPDGTGIDAAPGLTKGALASALAFATSVRLNDAPAARGRRLVESVDSESLSSRAQMVADVESETAALWSDTDGGVRFDEDSIPMQVDVGIRSSNAPAVSGREESGDTATIPLQRAGAGDVTVSGIHTGLADEPRTEPWSAPQSDTIAGRSSPARRALSIAAAIGSVFVVALAVVRVAVRPDAALPAPSAPGSIPDSTPAAPSVASFASASASAPSSASAPTLSSTRATTLPRPVATSDSCKPPYIVDSDGIRHPKLHCLGRR